MEIIDLDPGKNNLCYIQKVIKNDVLSDEFHIKRKRAAVASSRRTFDKSCLAMNCQNSYVKTPNKKFFSVPFAIERRKEWCSAVGKDPSDYSPKSGLLVCEDHFNLDTDAINYSQLKLAPHLFPRKHLRLKKDAIPQRISTWTETPDTMTTAATCEVTTTSTTSSIAAVTAATSEMINCTSPDKSTRERSKFRSKHVKRYLIPCGVVEQKSPSSTVLVTKTSQHLVPSTSFALPKIIYLSPIISNIATTSESKTLEKCKTPEVESTTSEPRTSNNNDDDNEPYLQIKDESGEDLFEVVKHEPSVCEAEHGLGFPKEYLCRNEDAGSTKELPIEEEIVAEEHAPLKIENNISNNKSCLQTTEEKDESLFEVEKHEPSGFESGSVSPMEYLCEKEDTAIVSSDLLPEGKMIISNSNKSSETIKIYSNDAVKDKSIKHNTYNKKINESSLLGKHRRICNKEKSHKCTACKFEFKSKNIKRSKKLYKCYFCKKVYKYVSGLNLHLRIHAEKKYECNLCKKAYSDGSKLISHIRTHGVGPYECGMCEKTFNFNYERIQHRQIHTGEKQYNCEICKKKFIYSMSFQRHLQVHPEGKVLKCDVCEKIFNVNSKLIPCSQIDAKKRKYKCNLCQEAYSQDSSLFVSLPTHRVKPYKCEVCEETFTYNIDLAKHMRVHIGKNRSYFRTATADKIYKCNLCEKAYSLYPNLIAHLRNHKIKPYKCVVCEETFGYNSELATHMKMHTGENQSPVREMSNENNQSSEYSHVGTVEKIYNCNLCEKSYSLYAHLVVHLRTHQVKPYKCVVCEKTFNYNIDLTKHMRTHTGENQSYFRTATADKMYKCSLCEKSYSLYPNLIAHLRIHKIKPYKCVVCEETFGYSIELATHMKIHTGENQSPVREISNENKQSSEYSHVDTVEKTYNCNLCEKTYSLYAYFVAHLRTHRLKPYKCEVCEETFSYNSELTRHIQIHTGENESPVSEMFNENKQSSESSRIDTVEKMYNCNLCEKSYSLHAHLVVHLRTHSVEQYKCVVCEETFGYNSELATHMKIHTGENPSPGSETPNENEQSSKYSHIDTVEKTYNCNVCEKTYSLYAYFVAHLRTHGLKPYKCVVCEETFNYNSELATHIKAHTGENQSPANDTYNENKQSSECSQIDTVEKSHGVQRYKCEVCEKTFDYNSELATHIKVHIGENQSPANDTSNENKQSSECSQIGTVEKIHGVQRYKCEVCAETFNHGIDIIRHNRTHILRNQLPVREVNKYSKFTKVLWTSTQDKLFECVICNRRFKRRGNLRDHIKLHTREGKVECKICQKKFTPYRLKIHMRIHNNERPFNCKFCESKFRERWILRKHVKMKHFDESWHSRK